MVKFTEVIEASIEWTTTVLFRPFSPKKWLILAFSAWMAGYIVGSSANFGNSYEKKEAEAKETSPISALTADAQETKQSPPNTLKERLGNLFGGAMPVTFVIIIVLLILAFVLLIMWLNSRFSFVFLDNVINNDASIKAPFKAYKERGNSLFLFYLSFTGINVAAAGLIILACFMHLAKIGVFNKAITPGFKQIFLTCLPYGLVLLLFFIAAAIISLIVRDFVTMVMLREKIRFLAAWPKVIAIINANKKDFIKYIFILIGLGICCGIIGTILYFACFIGLLLPAGITALIFYLIYLVIPAGLRFIYFVLLVIVLTPAALCLFYCLMCLNLPFAVFFRTLSLKFFGRLNPHYNLFEYVPSREVAI